MFYSRPKLPPLNIDLLNSIDLGTDCPSQFEAEDRDGNEIWIRYRNGWLTVTKVVKGADGVQHYEELASHRIGPFFEGDIFLDQVCDLLGITIDGKKPVAISQNGRATGPSHCRARDFSGQTTYWIGNFIVTRKSVETLFNELNGGAPPIVLLQSKFDMTSHKLWLEKRLRLADIDSSHAFFGIGGEPDRAENFTPETLDHAFKYIVNVALPWNYKSREKSSCFARSPFETEAQKAFGRKIRISPGRFSNISTKFKTGDPFAARFVAAIEECFSTSTDHIDLASSQPVAKLNSLETWYGKNLLRWCTRGADRYVVGYRDENNKKLVVGIRPSSEFC